VRQLILPEQLLQLFLTLIHLVSFAWIHFLLQAPIALWHVFCLTTRRPPVRVVLGKPEKFQRSLLEAKKLHVFKAALYSATLVLRRARHQQPSRVFVAPHTRT
jgi:hypothetical protein